MPKEFTFYFLFFLYRCLIKGFHKLITSSKFWILRNEESINTQDVLLLLMSHLPPVFTAAFITSLDMPSAEIAASQCCLRVSYCFYSWYCHCYSLFSASINTSTTFLSFYWNPACRIKSLQPLLLPALNPLLLLSLSPPPPPYVYMKKRFD